MKLVVITNDGSLFGKKVLNDLTLNGIKLDGLIIVRQPFDYYWRLFRYVRRRVGVFDAVYFSLKRLLSTLTKKPPRLWKNRSFVCDYRKFGVPVYLTSGTNSAKTRSVLAALNPDLLILGQVGIVKKPILEIPKIGVLNTHPGFLPFYRGIDCYLWAIYNCDFQNLGASVHWVNEGVDRGDIIKRARCDIAGSETLDCLAEKIDDLAVSLLTEVIVSIALGKIPAGEKQGGNASEQYYKMPCRLEKVAKKKFDDFLAKHREEITHRIVH